MNPELPEFLQRYSEGNKTGCLVVNGATGQGRIYLQEGKVVYAESSTGRGLYAFFSILSWEQASVDWQSDMLAPKITFAEPADILLYHFAQLEDNNQTDDESLRTLFDKTDSNAIKLTELKNYEVSFEVLNTDFKGFTFFLTKPLTLIGRHEDCDVVLPDASISGHHCTVSLEKNCITINDLGTTNGTFVNETLVSTGILQLGDHLMLGSVLLQLNLRLMRKLQGNDPSAAGQAQPDKKSIKVQSTLTSRITPKPLSRKSGPITWQNVGPVKTPKSKNASLLGRLFKK